MTEFDVVIMGGGPAGSTLGALLAKTDLRVAIVEREFFPREHIGESFSHRIVPILEESGALEKVLASNCWIKKYGGYYWWDELPATTYFEHHAFEMDGVHRWAMHVDRARFDKILLDHARSVGVHVVEGLAVVGADIGPEWTTVSTNDGTEMRCRVFVEAAGRAGRTVLGLPRREFQSRYKNLAIWNHYLGCKVAESLDGDWNIFREEGQSAIGNFAFKHGWIWYIPVRKNVLGEDRVTHSIGIVTDGRILRDQGRMYTDPDVFMDAIREVPALRELAANAVPIHPTMSTATNYSMISDSFCDYDARWIRVGDSAYFVDPLFSSGVAFAANHAATASLLIRHRLMSSDGEQMKRDLWADYDEGWHQVSGSFSLAIDQWYHAIAQKHDDSVYWRSRADASFVDVRLDVFQSLVDTGTDLFRFIGDGSETVKSDFFHVLTKGSDLVADIGADGPLLDAVSQLRPSDILPDERVFLADDVEVRPSVGFDAGKVKATVPAGQPVPEKFGAYWRDPVANRDAVEPLFGTPDPCYRIVLRGKGSGGVKIPMDADPQRIIEELRSGPEYGALASRLTEAQMRAVRKLAQLGMLRREG